MGALAQCEVRTLVLSDDGSRTFTLLSEFEAGPGSVARMTSFSLASLANMQVKLDCVAYF